MKIAKMLAVLLVCLAVLGLAMPSLAWAQPATESSQLKVLGELVAALTELVSTLTEHLEALEVLWRGADPVETLRGSCVLGSSGGMHDSTVMKYKAAFDEWPDPDSVQLFGVSYADDTGIVGVQYKTLWDDRMIIEFWQGCEMQNSTDWWEGSWDEKPFQGY